MMCRCSPPPAPRSSFQRAGVRPNSVDVTREAARLVSGWCRGVPGGKYSGTV